jgi:hypothetical protein
MKKYIKYIAAIVIAAGVFTYYYINKPKTSLENKEADVIISPQKLLEDFTKDEQQANAKYLDKIIEVSGKVAAKNIDQNKKVSIMMDTGDPMSNVTCELSKDQAEKSSAFDEGSFIEVKGKCTGMLTDVILVDCVILTELNN